MDVESRILATCGILSANVHTEQMSECIADAGEDLVVIVFGGKSGKTDPNGSEVKGRLGGLDWKHGCHCRMARKCPLMYQGPPCKALI